MKICKSGWLVLFAFFGADYAFAQTALNLTALEGCWSAKKIVQKTSLVWTTELLGERNQGECGLTAEEHWFVCLTQDADGNLNGELRKNRNQRTNGEGGLICSLLSPMSLNSTVYRCKILPSSQGSTEVVFDRCESGHCSDSDRRTMSVSIVKEVIGWSMKFSDGKVVTFEPYKAKQSESPK
jgi:hypothetical protein